MNTQALNHRTVTVLYGEKNLQKTMALPVSTTVMDAKKIGSAEILKHLHIQPGIPSAISIDEESTDFYPSMIQACSMFFMYSTTPDALDTARIGDLNGQVTVVLWPKAENNFTPSPVMDAFSSTLAELENLRAQQSAEALIKEEQLNQRRRRKPKPG
jgi:hypothetical protein